jgi:alkylation response protein AidB-like acyl-CoA dehydrogenase
VKHLLAETVLVVESSKAAAWYAAYAIANDLPDRSDAVSVAKAYASEAAKKANTESLQVHGGIGFTWEHDLHLWLKRGKALEFAYGTAREHRARLAERIFATA